MPGIGEVTVTIAVGVLIAVKVASHRAGPGSGGAHSLSSTIVVDGIAVAAAKTLLLLLSPLLLVEDNVDLACGLTRIPGGRRRRGQGRSSSVVVANTGKATPNIQITIVGSRIS